jgi:hypothetical protein
MRSVIALSLVAMLAFGCVAAGDGKSTPPSAAAVGAKPDGDGRAKLWLSASDAADGVVLKVNHERGSTPGARVADIRVAFSEQLELVTSKLGSGAEGKELTVQSPQPGLLRLVLLSKDTSEMASGELVEVKFRRVAAGPAKFDLLMDKPVFAPAAAMQGLIIGEPVQL